MSVLDRAKLVAEIMKLGAEVTDLIGKLRLAQRNSDKDARIAELEAQIAELKRKAGS